MHLEQTPFWWDKLFRFTPPEFFFDVLPALRLPPYFKVDGYVQSRRVRAHEPGRHGDHCREPGGAFVGSWYPRLTPVMPRAIRSIITGTSATPRSPC